MNLAPGWSIKLVHLDDRGFDENGWYCGLGQKLWLITDGLDSCTVRADTAYNAIQIAAPDGAPTRLGRINWGREHGTYYVPTDIEQRRDSH